MRRGFPAYRLFFLGAALFAALAVPLWTLQFLGRLPVWQADPAAWHGHEMLFGFALAVVGGFLITKGSKGPILAAFAFWLAGRILHLAAAPPTLTAAADLAYLAMLFWLGGLPFLRAAKTWRNAVFGLVVVALLAAELVYRAGTAGWLADGGRRGLILAVDLIILLMFTMGGRLIAAATSGAFQRKGGYLPGVAQPTLERIGVLALLVLIAVDAAAVGAAWSTPYAAAAAIVAAIVVVARLARWRAWEVAGDFDVSVLFLGYGWLALGLLVEAGERLRGMFGLTESIHGVMVGALGSLALAVMARSALQRARRPLDLPRMVRVAVGLVTLSALLRVLAMPVGPLLPLILGSAAAWMAAFLLLAVFLLRLGDGA